MFRLGSQVENYPAMLLLNILLFDFFSQATQQASTSVVRNESVVRKMQFPRLVIPLSVVLTNALQTGLSLIVVFVFLLVYGVEPVWTWLFLPLILGALAVLTTACALLLSAAYVRIRDIGIIWAVLSTVLFYASPILYPIEVAPACVPGPDHAQPADAAVRADARVDHRPERARRGRGGGGTSLAADDPDR